MLNNMRPLLFIKVSSSKPVDADNKKIPAIGFVYCFFNLII